MNNTSETSTASGSSIPHIGQVLLATDFSVASVGAFQTAVMFCHQFCARLLILHVFEYSDVVAPGMESAVVGVGAYRESALCKLNALRRDAQRMGVEAEAVMDEGVVSTTILETIQARGVDLVVLGTNASRGLERLIFGSTAEMVLRKAPCPVLTVGPHVLLPNTNGNQPGPVIFATDFNTASLKSASYAAMLSQRSGADLHCLHVLPHSAPTSRETAVPQVFKTALQLLVEDGGPTEDQPVCALVYDREVSAGVVKYAAQQEATLIVLGVQRALDLASHLRGQITYRIIAEATCPVLTVCFPAHRHSLKMVASL